MNGLKLGVVYRLVLAVFIGLLGINNAHGHFIINNEEHHDLVKDALESYNDGNYSQALEISKSLENKTHQNSIRWLVFMEAGNQEETQRLIKFYEGNKDWPFRTATKKRIEQSFNESTDPSLVIGWFSKYPAVSAKGEKIYLKALSHSKQQNKKALINLVRSIWHDSPFTPTEERIFESKYAEYLTQDDHLKRIDYLIWQKNYQEARKLTRHLDKDHAHLFNARLAFLENKTGKEFLLKLVPRHLKNDQGLLYSILLRYSEEDDHQAYNQYLDNIDLANMENVQGWCNLINLQVRNLIEAELYTEAYDLSLRGCRHNVVTMTDAEWLSGWIALRSLEDSDLAKEHFTRLVNNVKMPISSSRAAYWLARAYQASNEPEEAKKWYIKASDYPFTFYGQLSLEELGHKKINNIFENKVPKFSDEELKTLSANHNLNIAYIVSQSRWYDLAYLLINEELEKASSQELKYMIVAAGKKFGRMDLSMVAAKRAMYQNVADYEAAYPYIKENFMNRPVLVNSLTRQESLFNRNAVSSAGAMGLMQLMPKTAIMTAKQLGIKYSEAALTRDGKYNLRLGSHHIDQLHGTLGSNILSIASYNAGESPIHRWIVRFGDPRKINNTHEIVDWIEKIPYSETRNYVQRVIENMQIYHSIIHNKKDLDITISKDLRE